MRFIPALPESPLSLSRRAIGPMFGVLVLFYLGFHVVSGERGLFALFKENRKLEARTAELADIRTRRETLEKRVKLMSNDSLDLDMLDEQSRTILGLAGKDEVVIFLK